MLLSKDHLSALLAIAAMVPEHEATLFDFKVDFYEERAFRKLLRAHQVVAITSMTPKFITHLKSPKWPRKKVVLLLSVDIIQP